jgi:hypothetical protein
MSGYTIRIFVADGDPEGVRIIDQMNWTGKGIVFPRSLLAAGEGPRVRHGDRVRPVAARLPG